MDMMEVCWMAYAYMSSMLHGSAPTIHMLVATSGQPLMTVFFVCPKTPEGRSATLRVQGLVCFFFFFFDFFHSLPFFFEFLFSNVFVFFGWEGFFLIFQRFCTFGQVKGNARYGR